jgi:S1-C subfamily serine protease
MVRLICRRCGQPFDAIANRCNSCAKQGFRGAGRLGISSQHRHAKPDKWTLITGSVIAIGVLVGLVVFVTNGGNGPSPASTPAVSWGADDGTSERSVVLIQTYAGARPCSRGSGVVYPNANTVISNDHVVASSLCDVDRIEVWLPAEGNRTVRLGYRASVIGRDADEDLALLAIEPAGPDVPRLVPLVPNESVPLALPVTSLGFPGTGGASVTVSRGIVSGFAVIEGLEWIKTDVAVSPGNSGGPLIDDDRRLVGVITSLEIPDATDCRVVVDTNGDGSIDNRDNCVAIGTPIALAAPIDRINRLVEALLSP